MQAPRQEATRRSARARSSLFKPDTPKVGVCVCVCGASSCSVWQSGAKTPASRQTTPKGSAAKSATRSRGNAEEDSPFFPLPERDEFVILCPDLESLVAFHAGLKDSKGTHDRALCDALEVLSAQYTSGIFDGTLKSVQRKAKQRCLED